MSAALRVAVVGATGALGGELVEVLEASRLPVAELVPIATDRALGEEVSFAGDVIPVETEVTLRGLDIVFLCTPPAASLEWIRECLRAEVPCIDVSAALADRPETPLLVADWDPPAEELAKPVLEAPAGPALAWALALAPLADRGIERVVATSLEPASTAGRVGIDVLQAEVVALFNQEELPEPFAFARNLAFDCLPIQGDEDEEGAAERERAAELLLARLLGGSPEVDVTSIQVPTFAGSGASLVVETREAVDPREAEDRLAKTAGIELWPDAAGPTTRDTSGGEAVLVGRVRPCRGGRNGLRLWVAADAPRLCAANAVRLAEARLLG